MVKWYSLFSHTGKETENVQKLMGERLHLEVALTNNLKYDGPLPCIKLQSGNDINEWLMEPGNVEPGSIITLNGYMRIVPAEVLDYLASIDCRVFNIHPAPIGLYPDLKGKDPQERLFAGLQDGTYTYIGVVIHEVDPGVDTGRIVHWTLEFPINFADKDGMYKRLHEIGTELWIEFFSKEMWRNGKSRQIDCT